jgi:hypothetical protein
MVVHNFDVVGVAPGEAQPPLVVDADAVLSGPVAGQRLQVVGRGLAELRQPGCRGQRPQLAPGNLAQIAREALGYPVGPDRRRALVRERSNGQPRKLPQKWCYGKSVRWGDDFVAMMGLFGQLTRVAHRANRLIRWTGGQAGHPGTPARQSRFQNGRLFPMHRPGPLG